MVAFDSLTPTRVEPTRTSPPAVPSDGSGHDAMAEAALACGFDVMKPLGSGGMATVFLAMDQNLQRPVALKFPTTAGRRSERVIELLKREAENAASLIHENIVQVYSWHQHGDFLFFAMELVQGETLLERVKEHGPMDPADALRVTMECANGLAVAHQRGIIHHDIKPANIMLRHDGRVKVADLGISTNADDRSRNLQAMLIRGTTGFMAPEQARGEVTTPGSDIYSLGITLYFALTGKSAFSFPPGTPRQDRLKLNQTGKIRPITEFVPHLPKPLLRLLGLMLEPAPSRRFPNMLTFQHAARKVFLGLEKRPETWFDRQVLLIRKSVRYLRAPALIAMGGIAGGWLTANHYESTTVPQARLKTAGKELIQAASRQSQAIYAANPTNGLIGTAAGLVAKAEKTQDFVLGLAALEGLRQRGILKFGAPEGAHPPAAAGKPR